jgi:hypothetical protein
MTLRDKNGDEHLMAVKYSPNLCEKLESSTELATLSLNHDAIMTPLHNLYVQKNLSEVNEPNTDIRTWLQQFKVNKGQVFTHTLMTGGSFNIPNDHLNTLFRLLSVDTQPLSLTEKHLPEQSPMIIDFDFRLKHVPQNRVITDQLIDKVVQLYHQHIRELGVTDDAYLITIVLTRSDGYISGEQYKDGFHLQLPFLVIDYPSQFELRRRIIEDLKHMPEFPHTENGLDDVVDLSVIQRNNWLLLGCCKPNLPPYEIRQVYWVEHQQPIHQPLHESIFKTFSKVDLIALLSIRATGDRIISKTNFIGSNNRMKSGTLSGQS